MNDTYHLHSWGDDGNTPVLLLHGFTGHGGSWAAAGQAFAAEGFRALAPDLLGHGRSPHPRASSRYKMRRAADDLADLLAGVTEEAVHLLGYSMGGRLALYFALAFPGRVKTLTLASASPGLASAAERAERRGWDNALADHIEKDGVEAFVDYWEALPMWKSQRRNLSEEQRAQLRAQRLKNRPSGLANSLRGMGTGAQPGLHAKLPSLAVPTLLLAGAEDGKFVRVNQRMADSVPNARLVVFPATGHAIHLERPTAFARAVLSFWHSAARSPTVA